MIRQFSAGGVVYKKVDNEILYLLRQNSGTSEWTLPKGWLDDASDGVNPGPMTLGVIRAKEDEIRSSALREVTEETGVQAKIVSRLGTVQFFFVDHTVQRVMKTVIFYLMEYQNDSDTGYSFETSAVLWVQKSQAQELLKKRKGEAALITKAEYMINSGQQTLL
jgi:8-oxo-dGTP diphosphatase